MRTTGGRSLAVACLLLAAAAPTLAQGASSVHGRVVDASGAPLPGVSVEARGRVSSGTASTDAAGAYEVTGLWAGGYDVSFRLPSFATSLERNVLLREGSSTALDVTLQLALSAEVLVAGRRSFRSLTDLDAPAGELVGIAGAATEGVVTAAQLEERAIYRVGEVLETVPGVIISQHSGEGKANQYYVRGFNIDHGTDLATTVAGVPVNLPTHAHGHGYTDLNFLIPELVGSVQYKKGPYYAEEGDFSAAGAININYVHALDRPLFKLEAGADRYARVLLAASPPLGGGRLLLAGEVSRRDGPWIHPDDYRKLNAVVRYSRGGPQNGFTLTGIAYAGEWSSTDQVPARAVLSGALPRFGAIDPSDGGRTSRFSLSAGWRRRGARTLTEAQAYAIKYGLKLFSNFTYFLDDPVRGDQFEQEDRRVVTGLEVRHRWLADWGRRDAENLVGLQLRHDGIPTIGLYHTQGRRVLETFRKDEVSQTSAALYFQNSLQWMDKLRTVVGVRGDLYHFDVHGRAPAGAGSAATSLLSPKLTTIVGPWAGTELYLNWGYGFHSNDGRALSPLVRARGGEIGLRTTALPHLHSTLSFWGLDIASELVFSGDAGSTEASRSSRRVGIEWASDFSPLRWLRLDGDLGWSRARYRDRDVGGDRIPGAIEGVASAGISVEGVRGLSGSLRVRYFGPRPLVEDDRVRSKASTLLTARVSCRVASRYSLTLDAFNLTDAKVSDVDYFYASRLPGEPREGVGDVHTHPVEPRSFRVSLAASF